MMERLATRNLLTLREKAAIRALLATLRQSNRHPEGRSYETPGLSLPV